MQTPLLVNVSVGRELLTETINAYCHHANWYVYSPRRSQGFHIHYLYGHLSCSCILANVSELPLPSNVISHVPTVSHYAASSTRVASTGFPKLKRSHYFQKSKDAHQILECFP